MRCLSLFADCTSGPDVCWFVIIADNPTETGGRRSTCVWIRLRAWCTVGRINGQAARSNYIKASDRDSNTLTRTSTQSKQTRCSHNRLRLFVHQFKPPSFDSHSVLWSQTYFVKRVRSLTFPSLALYLSSCHLGRPSDVSSSDLAIKLKAHTSLQRSHTSQAYTWKIHPWESEHQKLTLNLLRNKIWTSNIW